jgi:hypothetical protein
MHCLEGRQLETVHDIALRVYLEALAAAKMNTPSPGLSAVATDKAVALQTAYDELMAHIKDCKTCKAAEDQTRRRIRESTREN